MISTFKWNVKAINNCLISVSCHLQALTNENIRNASFNLPEDAIVIPGQKPSSPNLAAALRQNKALRSAGLYHLSDNSVLTGIPKPSTPTLKSVLQNDELRGVNYR